MQLIWEEFLKLIKEEVGSQVVETWFKVITLDSWDQSTQTATLLCPNQFVNNWINDHYIPLLKMHLARLFHVQTITVMLVHGSSVVIKRNIIPASMAHQSSPAHPPAQADSPGLVNDSAHTRLYSGVVSRVVPDVQREKKVSKPEPVIQPPAKSKTSAYIVSKSGAQLTRVKSKQLCQLQPTYVFDTFVVGTSNSLAYAASRAICESPGGLYNPLFIYGGTGLGKTHLLHAIGNEIRSLHPSLIVHYETSDNFLNEFISSIRLDRIQQFRNKYQAIDVLLVDDVQFLSNKEQTQEVFFHIFNMLYEQRKQIVLSSDTFPKEIRGLQSRLKSRMEWGLVADIQMPDLETKIAILHRKAEAHALKLPYVVAEFIASRIISNIRELEGALIRVSAFATLVNQPMSLEMARKVLVTLSEKRHDEVQLETVLKIVAKHYGTTIHDIKSKKRHHEIAHIRQVALYLMKKLTLNSLQVIGKYIGGRDHSTVIHAIGKVEQQLKCDYHFVQKIKQIEQEIAMH